MDGRSENYRNALSSASPISSETDNGVDELFDRAWPQFVELLAPVMERFMAAKASRQGATGAMDEREPQRRRRPPQRSNISPKRHTENGTLRPVASRQTKASLIASVGTAGGGTTPARRHSRKFPAQSATRTSPPVARSINTSPVARVNVRSTTAKTNGLPSLHSKRQPVDSQRLPNANVTSRAMTTSTLPHSRAISVWERLSQPKHVSPARGMSSSSGTTTSPELRRLLPPIVSGTRVESVGTRSSPKSFVSPEPLARRETSAALAALRGSHLPILASAKLRNDAWSVLRRERGSKRGSAPSMALLAALQDITLEGSHLTPTSSMLLS